MLYSYWFRKKSDSIFHKHHTNEAFVFLSSFNSFSTDCQKQQKVLKFDMFSTFYVENKKEQKSAITFVKH